MQSPNETIDLPNFAPLSRPVARHLAVYAAAGASSATAPADLVGMDLGEALDVTRRFYLTQQAALAETVASARQRVEALLRPIVASDKVTTGWLVALLTAFSPDQRAVRAQHLAVWRESGVLRYARHGHPQPSSAAALLIARLIDKNHVRGWLPSPVAPEEPLWWCWRQDSPSAAPIAWPIPFPQASDLPPLALLWTPWAGAGWDTRAAATAAASGRPDPLEETMAMRASAEIAPGVPGITIAGGWISIPGRGALRLAHPELLTARRILSQLRTHWQPLVSARPAALAAAEAAMATDSSLDLLLALADALLPACELNAAGAVLAPGLDTVAGTGTGALRRKAPRKTKTQPAGSRGPHATSRASRTPSPGRGPAPRDPGARKTSTVRASTSRVEK